MFHRFLPFIILFNVTLLSAECNQITSTQLIRLVDSIADNFPTVQQARNQVNIAELELEKSQAPFDPIFSYHSKNYTQGYYSGLANQVGIIKKNRLLGSTFDFGYRDGSGRFPIYEDQSQTSNSGEFFTGITIPILRNMRIDEPRFQVKQREIDLKISDLNIFTIQNNTRSDLLQSFHELILAKMNREALNLILDNLEKQRDFSRERIETGLSAQNDLFEFDRFIYQNQSLIAEQDNHVAKNINYLSTLYLDSVSEDLTFCQIPGVTRDLPKELPNLKELTVRAFKNRPDLQIVEQQLELANLTLDFHQNQSLPELNLRAEYSSGLGSGDSEDTQETVKSLLQFNYPLFNRSASSSVEMTELKVKNIELNLELLKKQLSTSLFSFRQDILTLEKQLKLIESEVDIVNKLLNADYLTYNSGNLDLFQINQRYNILVNLEVEKNALYMKYFQTLVNLALFTNDPRILKNIYQQMLRS